MDLGSLRGFMTGNVHASVTEIEIGSMTEIDDLTSRASGMIDAMMTALEDLTTADLQIRVHLNPGLRIRTALLNVDLMTAAHCVP